MTTHLDPPEDPAPPTCPECGAETWTFYEDRSGWVIGCPECIKEVPAEWSEV